MFHPPNRMFSKLLSGLPSIYRLSPRIHPVLWLFEASRMPLAAPMPRFFVNLPREPKKSLGTRDVVKTEAFDIESSRFTFNVMKGKPINLFVVVISEYAKKEEWSRTFWLSVPAAKILLERLEAYRLRNIDGHTADTWRMAPYFTRFEDPELNQIIEFKLVKDLMGVIRLKICQADMDETWSDDDFDESDEEEELELLPPIRLFRKIGIYKRKLPKARRSKTSEKIEDSEKGKKKEAAIIVSFDGVLRFQNKLSAILLSYEKIQPLLDKEIKEIQSKARAELDVLKTKNWSKAKECKQEELKILDKAAREAREIYHKYGCKLLY